MHGRNFIKRIFGAAIAIAAIGGGYSLVAGLGGPVLPALQASGSVQDETTGYKSVTLAVGNMTCASCPVIIKRALEAVDGVRKVEVSFRRKAAVIQYDPVKTSAAKLVSATRAVGFPSNVSKAVE